MKEARRRRLVAYFKAKFNDDRAKLIKATGLTKGRIAQLFDPEQPFGEIAARRLALQLKLPPDYFEHDAPGASAPPAGSEPARPDFATREVTDSEWALLEDVRTAATDEELAAIRARAAKLRAHVDRLVEERMAAAKVNPDPDPPAAQEGGYTRARRALPTVGIVGNAPQLEADSAPAKQKEESRHGRRNSRR